MPPAICHDYIAAAPLRSVNHGLHLDAAFQGAPGLRLHDHGLHLTQSSGSTSEENTSLADVRLNHSGVQVMQRSFCERLYF